MKKILLLVVCVCIFLHTIVAQQYLITQYYASTDGTCQGLIGGDADVTSGKCIIDTQNFQDYYTYDCTNNVPQITPYGTDKNCNTASAGSTVTYQSGTCYKDTSSTGGLDTEYYCSSTLIKQSGTGKLLLSNLLLHI